MKLLLKAVTLYFHKENLIKQNLDCLETAREWQLIIRSQLMEKIFSDFSMESFVIYFTFYFNFFPTNFV